MNIDELFNECIRNIEAVRDELRDVVLIEVAATAPEPKPKTKRLLRPDELPPPGRLVLLDVEGRRQTTVQRLLTGYYVVEWAGHTATTESVKSLHTLEVKWSDNADWSKDKPLTWHSFEVEV